MFRKYAPLMFAMAALLLVPMVGCYGTQEEFSKLDLNKDGKVTAEEIDANTDGYIGANEVPGAYSQPVSEFMSYSGSENKDSLSPSEFSRAVLGKRMPWYYLAIIFVGVTVVPYGLGIYFANQLRMPDYGWKIGLILLTVASGAAITYFGWPPKLGVDLSGGVILIYEIDQEATLQQAKETAGDNQGAERLRVEDMISALKRRINPSGVKEVVIRPYGEGQVEIIIPNAEATEVRAIKERVAATGQLEFLIVATPRRHQSLIQMAQLAKQLQDPSRYLKNNEGKIIGRWVDVGLDEKQRDAKQDYQGAQLDDVLRARRVGSDAFEIINVPPEMRQLFGDKEDDLNLKELLDRLGYRNVQVLMAVNPNPDRNILGQHLRLAQADVDERGNPAVRFLMNSRGAALMGALTSDHAADKEADLYYRLGIVMDGELISAPRLMSTISDSGQISGRFTEEEVDFLVNILKAGRLPAVLRKEPISENKISSLLGQDTIEKGSWAIGLSLLATLVMVLVYYRLAGSIACLALLLNLLLVVASMIAIRAAFTLPGIAGLILSVGMSVDSNVLIFERMREELARGATLRMAIRNGFDRATTTIIDSNLTTLITAIVLYAIGTDQIRGFAVTLILGLVISMFTAIFVARVIFDILERKRWISSLSMMKLLDETNWDFMGRRWAAVAFSGVLIAISLFTIAYRGKQLFDIDFNGGTSVQIMLAKPLPVDQVRERVSGILPDVSVTEVSVTGQPAGTIFKIDTSLTGEEEGKTFDADSVAIVQNKLAESFKDELVTQNVKILAIAGATPGSVIDNTPATEAPATEAPATETPATETPATETPATETPATDAPATEAPPTEAPATDAPATETPAAEAPTPNESSLILQPGEAFISYPATEGALMAVMAQNEPAVEPPPATDAPASEVPATPPAETPATSPPNPPTAETPAAPSDSDLDASATPGTSPATPAETPSSEAPSSAGARSKASVEFGYAINAADLRAALAQAAMQIYGYNNLPATRLSNPEWDGASSKAYSLWNIEIALDESHTKTILDKVQKDLSGTPVWTASNKIGGSVAGDTQQMALAALFTSLLGIIAYIWVRFQRVAFGLAAVVALLHDVIITIGAIAVSMWLAPFLGFIQIDAFKIGLTVMAAILTVIGFSLNDTIVIFDRIREVRGKSPQLTEQMINLSVNQTLSRTILTSGTTIVSLIILYFVGGEGLHAFSYCLLVGIVVGTYSSIFIAAPVLMWMVGGQNQKPATAKSKAPLESAGRG